MTNFELSNEFDILYNNITSSSAPGLTEYEKSVLLTQAQEDIVKGLYNGNLAGKSFEETEELRRYLANLVITVEMEEIKEPSFIGVTPTSKFFRFPEATDKVWFITFEQVYIEDNSNTKVVGVIPMRQDEWSKAKDNPFRKPNTNRVIRMDYSSGIIELLSDNTITQYIVKYISKPSPIILEKLQEGLTIDGVPDKTECQLHTALHRVILERAVQLAYRLFPQASK